MNSTKGLRPSLLAVALLATTGGGAVAQDLPSGAMQATAVDPLDANTVLVSGNVSVYASPDKGATWRQSVINSPIWAILFEPFDPIGAPSGDSPVVLIATDGQGVLRDVGTGSWEPGTESPLAVRSLAADTSGNRIYAGADTGIYASDDRGASWQMLFDGLGDGFTQGLAVDPLNPLVIYASRWRQGVYRSTDGGQNWELLAGGLFDTQIFDLDARPDTGGVLYIATPSGIFESVDAGSAWNLLDTPKRASEVAIDPVDPDRMFASTEGNGIWRSTDGGQTWQRLTNGFGDVSYFVSVAVAGDGSGGVYAGTVNQGYWISNDHGDTWTSIGVIGDPPSNTPPPPPPEPQPGADAQLLVEIIDEQNGNSVSAGRDARFRVRVRNIGTGSASDVILGISWVRLSLTGEIGQPRSNSPSQGSCNEFNCQLGTIAAGAEAIVTVSASTLANVLTRYELAVVSKHDGSADWQGFTKIEISASVTIVSTESGLGGGGAGGAGLLSLLLAALNWRRSRPAS